MPNCIKEDRSAAPLALLTSVVSYGFTDYFEITWSTTPSYPEHSVEMIYRTADNASVFTDPVDKLRSSSEISSPNGLVSGIDYTVWVRAVIPGYYGQWQNINVNTTPGYIGGLVDLEHNGEKIEHLGEQVQVPRN